MTQQTTTRAGVWAWFALLVLVCALPLIAQTQSGPIGGPNAPDPRAIVGDPTEQPLTGDALEAKTKTVASELRCPVCQGLSVYDSPATMAVDMKHQVGELVSQGYSKEQILDYFSRSYGEFVLLAPKAHGINWLVWIAPIVILLGGAVVIWMMYRKSLPETRENEAVADARDLPGRDTLPEDRDLTPYVLRARELAYGWPGGVSPKTDTNEQ